MKSENHAIQNANGWASTIAGLVAAMNCDFDRLEELRDERADLVQELESTSAEHSAHGHNLAKATLDKWDEENGDELKELTDAATVDGDLFKDADEVRERIQESPLSVQIRTGWYTPGETGDAEEFEILLSTGGPALRIMGELDEHKQPHRAWLEYQDWGTPWTHHYVDGLADTLVEFASTFYFGD